MREEPAITGHAITALASHHARHYDLIKLAADVWSAHSASLLLALVRCPLCARLIVAQQYFA